MVRSGQEDFNNNVLERETEFLEPHLDVSRNFDERQEEPDPINAYPLAANTQHHPEQSDWGLRWGRVLGATVGVAVGAAEVGGWVGGAVVGDDVLGATVGVAVGAAEWATGEMEARARANGALELTAPGNAPVARLSSSA
ncbi:hypothetical protein CYMTET_49651 [Cymbomonas tetramitiformis]|uniref:Uncharacterized protein n=1 Tax=Cymbomonas tetramitiformis TaxID=36881 RepID=A0AAE0BQY7_9CHLO|nr:hypothetical protein CYMTET_49651 [Cymbomonas tetramitiformis]